MAIRFDNTNDYIARTTNLPTSTTNVSMACWAYLGTPNLLAAGDAHRTLIGLDDGNYTHQGLGMFSSTAPQDDDISLRALSGGTDLTTTAPTNAWIYIAWSCAGTGSGQLVGWLWNSSGTRLYTASTAGQSFTINSARCGVLAGASLGFTNLRVAYVRCWDRVLSESNFYDQMFATSIVGHAQVTSIRYALKTADLTDESGNGYDWTGNGVDFPMDNEPLSLGSSDIILSSGPASNPTSKIYMTWQT